MLLPRQACWTSRRVDSRFTCARIVDGHANISHFAENFSPSLSTLYDRRQARHFRQTLLSPRRLHSSSKGKRFRFDAMQRQRRKEDHHRKESDRWDVFLFRRHSETLRQLLFFPDLHASERIHGPSRNAFQMPQRKILFPFQAA